jgi:predicted DCC family thiol-disulfide oxidoreductase YuxK
MSNSDSRGTDSLVVLYDGACPVCRREIGVYRDLASGESVEFCDISDDATQLPKGATREELLARFHIKHADGRLESGARAFIALWARLPYWRWLALLGRLPGAAWLMEVAYRGFLRIRPAIQRWTTKYD